MDAPREVHEHVAEIDSVLGSLLEACTVAYDRLDETLVSEDPVGKSPLAWNIRSRPCALDRWLRSALSLDPW